VRTAVAAPDQHERAHDPKEREGGATQERRLEALGERLRTAARVLGARGRKPPKVSTYAFTTQARLLCEKSSARPIEGSATFTIDASSTTTNCATQSRTSAIQRRRS